MNEQGFVGFGGISQGSAQISEAGTGRGSKKPLPKQGLLDRDLLIGLEANLSCELNTTRTATTKKRVADAHVAGRGQRISAGSGFEIARAV